MKVILRERVYNLGELGSLVNVKAGFARNFLIPKAKAWPATQANMARFEAERTVLEHKAKEKLSHLSTRVAELENISMVITAQASEEGQLFGSVSASDIARKLTEMGHPCRKSEVYLPEGALRQLGEQTVELRLEGSDVGVAIKVVVKAA
jgi:large subunit ribosomal protein L9